MKKIIVYYKGAACVVVSNEEFDVLTYSAGCADNNQVMLAIEQRVAAGMTTDSTITIKQMFDERNTEIEF